MVPFLSSLHFSGSEAQLKTYRRGCDLGKRIWEDQRCREVSDLGKGNDFGKASDFRTASDFGKVSDLEKVSDLQKVKDLEKVRVFVPLSHRTFWHFLALFTLHEIETKEAYDVQRTISLWRGM